MIFNTFLKSEGGIPLKVLDLSNNHLGNNIGGNSKCAKAIA